MIKQYIKQLKSINKDGNDFYNFLLLNGKNYRVSKDAKKIAEQHNIRSRPKACYYNAQQLTIFSNGKYKYYEGYAISKVIGIPFEHAWNVLNNKIIDITWEEGVEYFGVEIPYDWIKKKFYDFAFKYKITDSHLMRYWEEKNQNGKGINKDNKQKVPGLQQGSFHTLQRNSKNCCS